MEFEPSNDDLQRLREWIQKKSYIVQHYDDQFLAAFVRACKGSLQKTKLVLENFNKLGVRYPDFFGTLDPLHRPLQENLSVWFLFPLPGKTPDDCTVIFNSLNLNVNDPSKAHIHEYFRYLILTVYVLIWENNFGSGKFKLIFDMKGCSIAHMKESTPMVIKEIIKMAESGLPLRIQSADQYNLPSILEHLCNLFKAFAKKKLAERISFHSTIDKLTDKVPQKMLPREYGGSEESIFVLHDNWKKKIELYRERFLEENRRMRELDHLRPQTDEENDGVGTFRKLNVD